MALYHVHVKTFSRGKGDSAIAACAYRLGVALRDERTGCTHDYTKRRGVYGSFSCAPDHAPAWASDPATCWQNAEAAEKRKDACVAREFELSLPRELTPAQNDALAREVAQHLVDRFGFAVTVGLHDFGTQPHAHILATTREINPDGFGAKTRDLDNRASGTVDEVRALVGACINRALAAAGHSVRVDHRSYANQCLDAIERGDVARALALAEMVPTVHEGKGHRARQRRTRNQRVREHNNNRTGSVITALEGATAPEPPHKLSASSTTALTPSIRSGSPRPEGMRMQTSFTAEDVEYTEVGSGAIYPPGNTIPDFVVLPLSHRSYGWVLRHYETPVHIDVSVKTETVLVFRDRSTITDHGDQVSARGGTPRAQAERICALAIAKHWTCITFTGNPDFLSEAFAQALRLNLPVHTQNDEQRALLAELEAATPTPVLPTRAGIAGKLDARGQAKPPASPRRIGHFRRR
ncbi:MobA/MobL family protein [Burkholderia vietnamiensis]|uniref:MobA/MobL family protein n=1 Tax=Burkholderia vietnamiensis TaxID=60552 RepID=UPI002652612D|nr:MobA/MobL family protein [Burkholderia vietnamiensis]MDN8076154.1 MobA/MobL family protein [Burkholderia vietnamiensis]